MHKCFSFFLLVCGQINIADEIFDNFMAILVNFGDFMLVNVEFSDVVVKIGEVFSRTLEVEAHIVVREAVSDIF